MCRSACPRRTDPLASKKEQPGSKLRKANSPLSVGSDTLHDLFTVCYNRDAAKGCFCLFAPFFLDRGADSRQNNVMNWLAVICAALAFWILGFVWYSLLFGKMWAGALQEYGVKLEPGAMAPKLIGTFIANFVAAVVMEHMITRISLVTIVQGLKLGLGVGIGFSATAITVSYLWQRQPFKVWLIDVSYYCLGAVLLGVILTAWG
jgi:Protein of unknown function (DUF1761)